MSVITYGPVPSWRLGRSLGIDLLSTDYKTCSFNCLYCQLGRRVHPLTERRLFVANEALEAALEKVKDLEANYTTFSGMGEPTLASNLGYAIELAKKTLGRPVAILTNASLFGREDVREDLAQADFVVAKLDAPTDELFQRINCPLVPSTLEELLAGIERFRRGYRGRLALQMMFIESNKAWAKEMAAMARALHPYEVQVNTPLRPSPVPPLSPAELEVIEREFGGLEVRGVYQAKRPQVVPLDQEEVARRRPEP